MPAPTPRFSPVTQPLEDLADRLALGEISLAQALTMAAAPEVTKRLDLPYAQSVADLARAQERGGNAAAALNLTQILRAAVEALPNDDVSTAIRAPGELAFLRAVRAILSERPDWRLYRATREVAARLLRRARRSQDRPLLRKIFAQLGELHFQPLVARFPNDASWASLVQTWYEQGRALSGDGRPFPSPPLAFSLALRAYRRAARGAPDEDRVWLLKGQISALEWIQKVRGDSHAEEIAKLIAETLPLMNPQVDLLGMTYLMALAHDAGGAIDAGFLHGALSFPLKEMIHRFGRSDTVSIHLNLAHVLKPLDPELTLKILERAGSVARETGDAIVLARQLNALVGAIIASLSNDRVDNSAGTLPAVPKVQHRAQSEGWPDSRVAGALLLLVEGSSGRSEEMDGLRLLNEIEKFFPEPFQKYPEAMTFWRMTLWSGEGVNSFNARPRRDREALLTYGNALRFALALDFREFALQQLKYFVNVVWQTNDDLLTDILVVLGEIGLKLEVVLGVEGVTQLQALITKLTERQVKTGNINSNLLHLTWQAGKARRFSGALRLGAARALQADDLSEQLLAEIAARRPQVSLAEEGTGPGSRIDRSRRLLAFVRDDTPASGATVLEQFTNLQARFDRRLEERLAQHCANQATEILGFEEMRAALPERTVLLQLFLGEIDEKRAVYALLGARSGEWLNATPDEPALRKEFREGDRVERAFSYDEDVYLLRSAILNEEIDEKNLLPFLDHAGSAFLTGGVGRALDGFRERGCDHLVIVPHGPFHFAPLHLFGRGGRLLADEWNVTILPTIELLRLPAPSEPTARSGLAAFGLSFSGENNPYHLPALRDSADEARRVAEKFGVEPIGEAGATESAVLAALSRVEYLHLATHGAMNLDAPSFHYIVVTPDRSDDGLLHAHELLQADLRGVRLVSLSACETALGRLDAADNPRGLPATLLLAGVETIVGTLWEVKGDVARAFFVMLYEKLAKKEVRGAAFRAAQLEARRRFPHPRDWGAFYLLGAWD
ncbi:MAG: CHAT domain-containing protein [Chthoniobacterales bacterium]